MRKIFSILLALGLVLGMVVATLPAAATPAPGDWTRFTVAVANPCEFDRSNYTFTFTPTADLHSGTHSITIRFPEGTAFPAVWRNGHITVDDGSGAVNVFGSEVTVDEYDVTFLLPVDIVGPGDTVTVVFQSVLGTGVRNPAAGLYYYYVKTSRAPNSAWVQSGWDATLGRYVATRIEPAMATYFWELDFSPTYPGIAFDYVPPFKACGQWSNYDPGWAPGDGLDVTTPFRTWEFEPGKYANNFTLIFGPGFGCGFCSYYTEIFLQSAPAGGKVWVHNFETASNHTMQMVPGQRSIMLPNDGTLITEDLEWELAIHFDKVGTYEICFNAWALDDNACVECQDVFRCVEFDVKQWKDAMPIYLGEKWNLMSLPIVPFDTSIEGILAPFSRKFAVRSIWHYDRCLDEWFAYGNGQTSLETMEDGKSYWVRMMTENEFIAAFTPVFGAAGAEGLWGIPNLGPPWKLWVFGTETPMPPAGPSAYLQCEGWNMLGFRSVIDRPVGGIVGNEYLYGHTFGTHYTAVYGWTGTAWQSLATTNDMEVGFGYWAYWQMERTVNPPL